MTNKEKALEMHKQWNGKLSVEAKCPVASAEDLAIAYTPGVAEPCRAIAENPKEAYTYTIKSNTVAVVSDGSAVLGLGNIGALAAMPVMEGKAALFKDFGGVNAFPICLDTQDTEEIIETVVRIAPAFGGINLEDIAAPRCLRSITALTLFLVLNYLYRITGHCFVFFPAFLRSRAKTISPVRSKYPMSFFQLMPHLQCCKPINCCFIFLPQFGHTFLLLPFCFAFGLSASFFFFSAFSGIPFSAIRIS